MLVGVGQLLQARSVSVRTALAKTVSAQSWVYLACVALVSLVVETAFWWGGLTGSFVAMALIPALLLWALALLVGGLFGLFRWRLVGLGAVLAVVLSPMVFVVALWGSGAAWDWGALAVNHNRYAKIVALAGAGRLPPPGREAMQLAGDGTRFQAERRPPGRIAFDLPGSFLNSHEAILYDPSGVGRRRLGPGKEDLFDEWWTLESCSHMIGRYYRCSLS